MGPSGCGKTTLLNVLARRDAHAQGVSGAVLVNGDEVPLAMFRDLSCFVEQEDALIGSLTVRETIDFAARLSTNSRLVGSLCYPSVCPTIGSHSPDLFGTNAGRTKVPYPPKSVSSASMSFLRPSASETRPTP